MAFLLNDALIEDGAPVSLGMFKREMEEDLCLILITQRRNSWLSTPELPWKLLIVHCVSVGDTRDSL